MKAKPILFLAGLAFLCGCRRPGPVLVPELSPPLIQEEVCSWEEGLAGEAIFPCAGGIGWIDTANHIVVCDTEKKKAAPVFTVPFAVGAPPFRQGDLLVLQDKAGERLLVYDLAAGAVKFEALRLGVEQVLGIDNDCLVYLEGGRLAVNFWRQPGTVFHAEPGEARFFNCHFTDERILILGAERLHSFGKKSGRFEAESLPQPALSPFLFADGHVVYGSSGRFLMSYSPLQKKLAWKVKLGQLLTRQPLACAGAIVASPSDQSVLKVSRRGTIRWWQALGSTLSFDLAPMSAHLAAILLNREVRFIDPRQHQASSFKISVRPAGAPVAFRGGLYFMSRQGKTCRLQRVGSRFGVDIELEPAAVRWSNRSLRFTLRFHNLPEPFWDCVVRDAAGGVAFSKSMAVSPRRDGAVSPRAAGAAAAPVTLAWVPLQAGMYTVRVRVRSLGRDWESEMPVQVLDPLQVVPMFRFHL